jgi:hypothetical protein
MRRCCIILSLSIAACCGAIRAGAEKPSPMSVAKGNAFSLFDGKTLDGWTIENGAVVEIQDGQLLLKDGNGWLRSDHQYADFKIHVEWKALKAEKYDAGIYIRSSQEGTPFPKPSYQINLLQGKEGNISNLPGASSTGLIKSGDWNTFEITVVADTVALEINGKPAYKVGGLKAKTGYIGLQVEVPLGGQYLIRNMKVTELGYQSLFNGEDLTGWEGADAAAEKCWEIQDGVLACTGQKGPWLRSAKEYGDFNFRLDYQVSAGGNSGVYVRVPKDGNHHRENDSLPAAGFEVQMLDDAADQYKDLKDYQFSASVYDIAGAKPRNSKPHGQWNTLEIDCLGGMIKTVHNGKTVVEVSPDSHPLSKLRQQSGFLGLQNHSTLVRFRNIRIADPTP